MTLYMIWSFIVSGLCFVRDALLILGYFGMYAGAWWLLLKIFKVLGERKR